MLDTHKLISWFQKEKRDLPWRNLPTPYAVWVSEVMLQQTQVSVVIPYFEKWMETFPTIEALANSSLDKVMKLWEGLGYYSRARNLHEGARYILNHHNGSIPKSPELLSKIKGIGEYTKGAILSFAFHQKYPAVDGNVTRVLCRFFLIEEEISKVKVQKLLKKLVLDSLPEEQPWMAMEALIELGAKVCQKKPHCQECPLRSSCQGYLKGKAEFLPNKPKKNQILKRFRAVAVMEWEGHLLARKVGKGEIMEGLHEFPYFEIEETGIAADDFAKTIQSHFGANILKIKKIDNISHSFTKYKITLFPFYIKISHKITTADYLWLDREMLKKAAFSSGHKKIISKLHFL